MATISVTQASQPATNNVLSRLQALFPPQASPVDTTKPPPLEDKKSMPKPPKFLKVRVVTWNMHDSLPKGDLEELLGIVPSYSPPALLEEPTLPSLSLDGGHPYHIVVVAGQECPSASGIPMGLGAGLKALVDKEHVKEKDKPEKHKVKPKEKEEDDRLHDDAPSGWTSILEDWLCNGGGLTGIQNHMHTNGSPKQSPGIERPPKEQGRGPYQHLVKHRLMGLYLTVYIHRDIRSLVRGTSKSAVTAGLIGGRVGNKGGVGISLNIDGTTFLLVNAHLAAHEGKVPHRLANLAKIKAELTVDDYLRPDDPRIMAEDITDKFDFTFLCGDLNFRLDISRLHADWLISRQDYAQALAFDQLRNLMHSGQAFVGFQEGPIDFAPTFKFDVLRTIKRTKTTKSPRHLLKHHVEKRASLYEVEERERDETDFEDEFEGGGEGTSMASSAWTSIHSRPTTDVEDDDLFGSSPNSQTASTPNLAHKISIAAAAHKAKSKWMALLSSNNLATGTGVAPSTPSPKWRTKHSGNGTALSTPAVQEPTPVASTENILTQSPPIVAVSKDNTSKADSPRHGMLLRPPPLRSSSTKSKMQSADDETDDDDKGIYDSSNKKRVPSWCDRILWKSTIKPDQDPEERVDLHRPRTRLNQFFVNAFRPLSYRGRRGSAASLHSNEFSLPAPPKTAPITIPHLNDEPEVENKILEDPNFMTRDRERTRFVKRCKSSDVPLRKTSPLPSPPLLSPSSKRPDTRLRRSFSAGQPTASRLQLPSPARAQTDHPTSPTRQKAKAQIQTGEVLPPVPPKDLSLASSRWRFFPFLTKDSPMVDSPKGNTLNSLLIPIAAPRKGDIVCLAYSTLDNRGMRRLEGRSDHRPVIGSYAVYT